MKQVLPGKSLQTLHPIAYTVIVKGFKNLKGEEFTVVAKHPCEAVELAIDIYESLFAEVPLSITANPLLRKDTNAAI